MRHAFDCAAPGPLPGSRGLRGEGQELVAALADHPVVCLGHFDPGAGQVTDRLGDHQPGVVGHLAQDLPVGVLLAELADVAGENSDRDLPSLE